MCDSLVDPFFRLQVSTLTLSRDLTRKREGVTAPGCSLPDQRLFCPPSRHTRPRAGHTRSGDISYHYVSTTENIADCLSKNNYYPAFKKFRAAMGVA